MEKRTSKCKHDSKINNNYAGSLLRMNEGFKSLQTHPTPHEYSANLDSTVWSQFGILKFCIVS